MRLIGLFTALTLLALSLQYLVFSAALAQVSTSLPNDGVVLMDKMQPLLLKVLAVTLLLLVPVLFWTGLLATFRLAGPLYRFQLYLGAVARGERPADCRLRKRDQLQSLCDLINEATRPIRESEVGSTSESQPADSIERVA